MKGCYKTTVFVNKTTKKILLRYLLTPALTLLLLWLIYRQVATKGGWEQQWQAFVTHWHEGSSWLLLMVLLLAPTNWMLEALKWRMLLQKIEPVKYHKALASTLTGIAFSIVTPNKIGDFAGRILYLKSSNRIRAAIATLISNLSQTLITYLFGIIGLVYFNIAYLGTWQVITLIAAIVSCAALAYLYLNIDKVSQWAEGKKWLRKVVVSIRILQRYSRKDLMRLLGVALLRFMVYNVQFLILANVLGAGLPWLAGFAVSGLMFWMITVIPSVFVADLGVRGFIATLLFTNTQMAQNDVAILAASYSIWLLNLALPAIIGSILLLLVKWIKSK